MTRAEFERRLHLVLFESMHACWPARGDSDWARVLELPKVLESRPQVTYHCMPRRPKTRSSKLLFYAFFATARLGFGDHSMFRRCALNVRLLKLGPNSHLIRPSVWPTLAIGLPRMPPRTARPLVPCSGGSACIAARLALPPLPAAAIPEAMDTHVRNPYVTLDPAEPSQRDLCGLVLAETTTYLRRRPLPPPL